MGREERFEEPDLDEPDRHRVGAPTGPAPVPSRPGSDDAARSRWSRWTESPLFLYGFLLCLAGLVLFFLYNSIRPAPLDPGDLNVK